MKKVTIIALAVIFLLSMTVMAVEKKSTGKPSVQTPKQDTASLVDGKGKKTEEPGADVKKPPSGNYDDFIDKNNNGIDDRAEKQPDKVSRGQQEKKGDSAEKPERK